MSGEFNMRSAIAKLRSEHVVSYLIANEWELSQQRKEGVIRLLGAEFEGGRFEMLLPASTNVSNYRTSLQRAIYKLCGIEDREPVEILESIFATYEQVGQTDGMPNPDGRSLKVRNSGETPLRIRQASRESERELLPGEAIELRLAPSFDGIPELERRDGLIIIHDA